MYLAPSIPTLALSYTKYLKSPTLQSFALYSTTSWEVEQEINNLFGYKSTGPFSIPTKLLKLLKSTCLNHCPTCIIAHSLQELFQISLTLQKSFQFLKRNLILLF